MGRIYGVRLRRVLRGGVMTRGTRVDNLRMILDTGRGRRWFSSRISLSDNVYVEGICTARGWIMMSRKTARVLTLVNVHWCWLIYD